MHCSPRCWQKNKPFDKVSEDCLYLNVMTPNVRNFPVLFLKTFPYFWTKFGYLDENILYFFSALESELDTNLSGNVYEIHRNE